MARTRADADLQRGNIPYADRLLDLCAVMAMTDMSESTVLRRVKAGLLPAPVKIGPQVVRWIESELVEAIRGMPRAAWATQATGRRMSVVA
jgi:predicted DNA-binding transcriptional regulator AlpA